MNKYLYTYQGNFTGFDTLNNKLLKQIYLKKIPTREELFSKFSDIENEKIIKVKTVEDNIFQAATAGTVNFLKKHNVQFNNSHTDAVSILVKNGSQHIWLNINKDLLNDIFEKLGKAKVLAGKKFYLGCSITDVRNSSISILPSTAVWTANKNFITDEIISDFKTVLSRPGYFLKNGLLPERFWYFKISIEALDD